MESSGKERGNFMNKTEYKIVILGIVPHPHSLYGM